VCFADCDWLLLTEHSFVIGREKDPSNSEVGRLIQDSIEQDRRRAEAARARERELLQRLHDRPATAGEEEDERGSDVEEMRTRQDSLVVCH